MRAGGIVVRVVEVRKVRWLGFLVALAGGLALAAIASHGWRPHQLFGVSRYWSFGLASFLWSVGTLITWRVRPMVTRADVAKPEVLRLGDRAIPVSSITGVKLARAERGYSIAVGGGPGGGMFLEVEREADARKLVAALDNGMQPCVVSMEGATVRWLSWIVGGLGCAFSLAYAIAVGGFGVSELKGWFGLPAVACGFVASVLFLASGLLSSKLRVGEHALRERSAVGEHLRLHVVGGANDGPAAIDTRVAIVDRGDETTAAWLARLDAMTADDGYRGGGLGAEELQRIAEDASAPPAARLGALRVLARHQGGVPEALRMRVADDLGARVRLVTEEASSDEIAAELDAVGPAFRARAR